MLRSRRVLAALTLLIAWQGGCEKRNRAVPPAPPSLPPMTASAAREPAGPAQKPPAMPAGHAELLHGVQGVPPAQPIPTASSATVLASGVIKIADAVKDKVKMGATIFVSGRGVSASGQPGMVLLAKKLMVNHSEIPFELTADDLMGMGGAPTGPILIAVRVDQDEDASTKQPGDVEGQLGPVTLPAKALQVVLSTVRKEGAGPPIDTTFGHGGAMPAGHGEMPAGHGEMPAGHGELPPGHIPVPGAGAGAKEPQLPPGHIPVSGTKPAPTGAASPAPLPKAQGPKPAGHP